MMFKGIFRKLSCFFKKTQDTGTSLNNTDKTENYKAVEEILGRTFELIYGDKENKIKTKFLFGSFQISV